MTAKPNTSERRWSFGPTCFVISAQRENDIPDSGNKCGPPVQRDRLHRAEPLSASMYDARAAKEIEHIELRSLIAKAQLASERRFDMALKNVEVVARLESLNSGQPVTRK